MFFLLLMMFFYLAVCSNDQIGSDVMQKMEASTFPDLVKIRKPYEESKHVCGDGVCQEGENQCSDCKPQKRFGIDGMPIGSLWQIGYLGLRMYSEWPQYWEMFQPVAPSKTGEHNYKPVFDEGNRAVRIKAYNQLSRYYGDVDIAINSLGVTSRWALEWDQSNKVIEPSRGATVPGKVRIKPEYRADWADAVKYFLRDYPLPIDYLQISNEAENAWVNGDGFVEALCIAYDAAKDVNSDIKILTGGFNLGELTAVDDDLIQDYINKYPHISDPRLKYWTQKMLITLAVLEKGKDCFDILTIHHDNGKTYDTAKDHLGWYRRKMKDNGYQKPIWFDDMNSGYVPQHGHGASPYDEWVYEKLAEKVTDPVFLKHYRKKHAQWTVRKAVGGFAEGIQRLFIQSDRDMVEYYMPEFRRVGMLHTDAWPLKNVYPTAAAYTTRIMVDKLDEFVRVDRLDNRDGYNYIFKFTFADKIPVLVLWYDDGIDQCPDPDICISDVEGSTIMDLSKYLSNPNAQLRITNIVEELNSYNAPINRKGFTVPATAVPVSETPIFVEEN